MSSSTFLISPKCNPSCFSSQDLAVMSGVSKKWRELATRIGDLSLFPGINAGGLYRLTDSSLNTGYLYQSRENTYTPNVLSANPLLKKVFEKSQTVVCFKDRPDPKKNLLRACELGAALLQKKLPLEKQVLLYQKTMQELVQQLSPKAFFQFKSKVLELRLHLHQEIIAANICFFVQPEVLFAERKLFDPTAFLLGKAAGKKMVQIDMDLVSLLSNMIEHQIALWVNDDADFFWTGPSEEGPKKPPSQRADADLAWMQGRESSPQPLPTVNRKLSDIRLPKRLKLLEKAFEEADQKYKSELDALKKKIDAWSELSLRTPQEIEEAMKSTKEGAVGLDKLGKEAFALNEQHSAQLTKERCRVEELAAIKDSCSRHLANFSSWQAEQIATTLRHSPLIIVPKDLNLLAALREKGIEVLPLRIPLKPRGYFWKLTDPKGRVACILGSMHSTPDYLLEFNEGIMDWFKWANTLALEIDVTKEGMGEKIRNQRVARIRKAIGKLSGEEKEKLVSLFQFLFTDPNVRFWIEQEKLPPPEKVDDFILSCCVSLEKFLLHKIGLKPGIDFKFLELAKQNKMPIEGLESEALHFEGTDGEEFMSWEVFLKDCSKIGRYQLHEKVDQVSDAMAKGFLPLIKAMEFGIPSDMIAQTMDDSAAEKDLMARRNLSQATVFNDLVVQGKRLFAIIGAAHTAGENSTLEILQEKFHYKARQIFFEEPDLTALAAMQNKI